MNAPRIEPPDGDDLAAAALPGAALHRFLREAHSLGGPCWVPFMGQDALLLTGFDQIRDFLSDDETFPGAAAYQATMEPLIGPTFISMEGHEHDQTRQLAMPAFRSRAVSRFVDEQLAPLADEVVDRFAGRGDADLVAELTEVLPYWSISRKLGLPEGREERQREIARALLSFIVTPETARDAATEVGDIVGPLIEARRAAPADDVLSRLIEAELDGRSFTDAEITSHIRLLYAVGATTTADAMSNMFRLVLAEPALVERARDEPAIRPHLVQEVLRLESPVSILPRIAGDGGVIDGVEIPPGAFVLSAVTAANRDPSIFTDPDRLDPDRPEHDIVSFGFGRKFCPGSHLGRRQLLAALDVVLDRLPDIGLVDAGEPTGSILRSVPYLRARWKLPPD